jgi:hypothetical protein
MIEIFGLDRSRQKREPNIWVKLSILRSKSRIFGSSSAYSGAKAEYLGQTQHTPEQIGVRGGGSAVASGSFCVTASLVIEVAAQVF